MSRFGFIHGKLDIKLLVLYLMSRVAAPIDFATLTDLALCDQGVDYFQFAEAVSELLDSGHLERADALYSITERGRRTCADTESSLSSVVRQRCDQRLAPLNATLKRDSVVRARVEPQPDGTYCVQLGLYEGNSPVFSLQLLAPTREDGEQIAQRFSQHPDRVFNGILGVLLNQDEARREPS